MLHYTTLHCTILCYVSADAVSDDDLPIIEVYKQVKSASKSRSLKRRRNRQNKATKKALLHVIVHCH